MTAAQWFALGVLAALVTACLCGIAWMLATEYVRDAYRKAGVRFDRHVDDALEVTK